MYRLVVRQGTHVTVIVCIRAYCCLLSGIMTSALAYIHKAHYVGHFEEGYTICTCSYTLTCTMYVHVHIRNGSWVVECTVQLLLYVQYTNLMYCMQYDCK